MEFFLPFQIPPYPFSLSYKDKILLVGSCFSEDIGNKMLNLKFDVLQNPNGILYDPQSIADAVFTYVENKIYNEGDLFELDGLWHSWKHHSAFSGINKNEVLQKINASQSSTHAFLKEAKFVIITLGTAFHYRLKNNNEPVGNCHKAPASFFTKQLVSIDDIRTALLSATTALEVFNPGLKIIFTVSPVKHVRDGVVENNHSKARLIEVSHFLCEQKPNVFYFPSYELVTDVLRDYRFYKNDLVHPNETAVNFVFDKFCDSFLDGESKKTMEEIKKILLSVNHKPFLKESDAHQKFVLAQIKNLDKIENDFPYINLSKEKNYFLDQLIAG
jgi:hypothetical protein